MTPFEAFQMFSAIRLHFTSDSYDFFKYHGKVRVDESRFETRNDKYFYSKLSRKSETIDLEHFLASLFLEYNKLWVGKVFEDECKDVYRKHKKVLESLEYTFKNEIFQYDDLQELLIVYSDGGVPKAYTEYKRGNISVECFYILAEVSRTWDYWLENVTDKIIFPIEIGNIRKYGQFIDFDRAKYKHLMLDNYSIG